MLRTSVSTMPHSIGVSRTSSPAASVIRLATRSTVNAGRDHGLLAGWRNATQRGPESGQQLTHAEGLGDVVVGAGVEGVDLVVLAVTGGQHEDRCRRPASKALHHVDATDPRETEIDNDDVGMGDGSQAEALLARGSQVDGVPAGRELVPSDRSTLGSSSTTRTWLIGRPRGGRSPSSRHRRGCPRSSDPRPWLARSQPPRPDRGRLPCPDRRVVGTSRNTSSRCVAGMPGPRSITRSSMRPARAPAWTVTGPPPPCRSACLHEVGERPLEQGRIGVRRREVHPQIHLHVPGNVAEADERGRHDLVDADRSQRRVGRHRRRCGSCRAG